MPVLQRNLFTCNDDEQRFYAEASDLQADFETGFTMRYLDGRTYYARPLTQKFDAERDLLYSDFVIADGDLRGWEVRVWND